MRSGLGFHHFHLRKRIHQKHEKYPHPDKWKNLMDRLVYFFGVFGPVMTIPQVAQVWIGKDARGVSPISWGAYIINDVFWITYGVMHREKPIILMYILWAVLNSLVMIGAIIYA